MKTYSFYRYDNNNEEEIPIAGKRATGEKALHGQLRTMSDRDLLALILGSGVAGANVKQIACLRI